MATPDSAFDDEVRALAATVVEAGQGRRGGLFHLSWWSDRLLDRAMANPAFKTELFRFVDVFPATNGDRDVLRHLDEYFSGDRAPRLLQWGVDLAEAVPSLGARVSATTARRNISRMAEQFIVGTTPAEAVAALTARWQAGTAATVDLLGEKTVVAAEADRYAERVGDMLAALLDASVAWPANPVLEADDLGPLPRVNVSVKPTALAPDYHPLTLDAGLAEAEARLLPLLHLARDRGAFVNLDMEHYEVKDLTLALLRRLLGNPELAGVSAGIVVQAYLKDSFSDLEELIALSASRPTPLTVRLVKGAYWDTETVLAEAAGWPVPVFGDKAETDANFERCTRLLLEHHGRVRAAFASHNLRSLCHAVVHARHQGIPDNGYELQLLAGMAEPVQAALRDLGFRVRAYCPVGELVPGMAYLVRRLLENTSNESFVRQSSVGHRRLGRLLDPPRPRSIPPAPEPVPRPPTDPGQPAPYQPEPVAEWRRAKTRAVFGAAVASRATDPVLDVPAVIDGERVRTAGTITSVDPARPDRVVAASAACGRSEAEAAVAVARQAAGPWAATPVVERAGVLFRAAAWLRDRRADVAALEVFEAGKPWAEADADVCEAIDFCEYYGREMLRLDAAGRRGDNVQSAPGEENRLTYQAKGVAVVIAPWNFPLAIPCGMTMAALAAGNAVVLKPAEQTPAIASMLVSALEAARLPRGVLGFLPGPGEVVGAALVEHPDVDVIVFTGSREVGLAINAAAAIHRPGQRSVKRVVTEMGGKNAVVVDADADLDQAVPAIVYSAFGYAGQKCSACSRLVVVDEVYDAVVDRVVGATRQLAIGHPSIMGTQLGPVIDAEAQERLHRYGELAGKEGDLLLAGGPVPDEGWFVPPAVVAGLDPGTSRVAREEIFGPILSVFRAVDFDDALAIAGDSDYALTAGVFSRSPAHIRQAGAGLRAGNVYVNRATTGAVVGRQPFGGHGMSGVGSKAGGPDYLLQFLDPRVVTENTLRQGFAPLEE